ncbi:DUF3710 domain-containing protein [Streptomyces sp. NPDC002588]|uniref:DUF3710 domain-containing protein n=1 Tax=Streptomyces sp. NPDC002588 TaxID=3154419 RepID=UPI003327D05D
MSVITARAAEIVEQFGRDGALTPENLALADFGVWERQSPGMVVVVAGSIAAVEDPAFAEQATGAGHEVLTTILSGDVYNALAQSEAGAPFRWEDWLGWLWAFVHRPGAAPDALEVLLADAAEVWEEIVAELALPRVRNGDAGPWDVSETPMPADTERTDYGVLKVPRLPGMETQPLRSGDRITGVTLVFGGHALGLRVFRIPGGSDWGTMRPEIIEEIRHEGGRAENGESRFGAEILAEIPVVRNGQRVLQPTRIIGCDGPGWLLRGTLAGPTALAEAVDPRVHHLFTQTVVDLPAPDGREATSQEFEPVDVHWPWE